MTRVHRLLIMIVLILPVMAAASELDDLRPFQGRVINEIIIIRKNIFDDEMLSNPPFYYRWANSLHIKTKENVVHRELLFDVGDTLDVQRIIETERNLRAGGFIGEIYIAAEPAGDSGVELAITTTDLWTTKAEIFLDIAGGNYTTGMSFTEANLLGLGKYVQVLGQAGNDQDGYAAYYVDSRLFGSRLSLDFGHTNFTYARGFSINLTRPQYSLTVPFGTRAGFAASDERPRLFHGGEEIFRYHQARRVINAAAIYTIGQNRRLNFSVGYDLDKFDYSADRPGDPLNVIIPPDETVSYPSIGIGVAQIKYDVGRFIDAGGNPEDLTLGVALKMNFGRSDKPFGANYIADYQAASAEALVHPRDDVYIASAERAVWWNRDSRNERVAHSSEMLFYYKPTEMHLLAIHALTDFAWRQKATYQVVLGGGNGLRGYSYHELAGSKLALGNIEYRFFTPITILTVRLGAAAFFDIGNVWRPSQDIDLRELKSGIGVGLRFGLTRASTARVISLDIARALSENKFFIGFGTASAFGLRNFDLGE